MTLLHQLREVILLSRVRCYPSYMRLFYPHDDVAPPVTRGFFTLTKTQLPQLLVRLFYSREDVTPPVTCGAIFLS